MKEDSQEGKPPECCGNAGPVETVENQTTVSHRSHRPLEIAKDAISTFPQHRRRFLYCDCKQRSRLSQLPARCREGLPLSGSSRIGIEVQFQAHPALE